MSAADRGAVATAGHLPGVNVSAILTRGFWTERLARFPTPPHFGPYKAAGEDPFTMAEGLDPTMLADGVDPYMKAVE